ncbi:MAG: hypothetical protein QOI74_3099 [Micromonosporaceae bacterium]|jgi:hypothetical protein|nr:hypothetical protein [Micromonosporaceae bacterium]
MADLRYNTGDLRTGGKHADAAAESAGQAASTLKSSQGGGSPFGNVSGAAELHGAVGHAQQHHALSAETSSKNMSTAAVRASGTADLGDDNTDETTKLAPRAQQAGTVAKGM